MKTLTEIMDVTHLGEDQLDDLYLDLNDLRGNENSFENCSALNFRRELHHGRQQDSDFSFESKTIARDMDYKALIEEVSIVDSFESLALRNFISSLCIMKNSLLEASSTETLVMSANTLTISLSIYRVPSIVQLEINNTVFDFDWDASGDFINHIISLCNLINLQCIQRESNEITQKI